MHPFTIPLVAKALDFRQASSLGWEILKDQLDQKFR